MHIQQEETFLHPILFLPLLALQALLPSTKGSLFMYLKNDTLTREISYLG